MWSIPHEWNVRWLHQHLQRCLAAGWWWWSFSASSSVTSDEEAPSVVFRGERKDEREERRRWREKENGKCALTVFHVFSWCRGRVINVLKQHHRLFEYSNTHKSHGYKMTQKVHLPLMLPEVRSSTRCFSFHGSLWTFMCLSLFFIEFDAVWNTFCLVSGLLR